MITAVDTSVLIAIVKHEPEAHAWVDALAEATPTANWLFALWSPLNFLRCFWTKKNFVKASPRSGFLSAPLRLSRRNWPARSSNSTGVKAVPESISFQIS